MSVHQMTRYVAIEMGTAARALTVWQEAGEELITLICVQQVFLAAQTSNTRPSLLVLKFEVNGRIAWILFNILIVKVVWYLIWQPLLWDTVELCRRRLQKHLSRLSVCQIVRRVWAPLFSICIVHIQLNNEQRFIFMHDYVKYKKEHYFQHRWKRPKDVHEQQQSCLGWQRNGLSVCVPENPSVSLWLIIK